MYLTESVETCLADDNVPKADPKPFKPHITLMKFSGKRGHLLRKQGMSESFQIHLTFYLFKRDSELCASCWRCWPFRSAVCTDYGEILGHYGNRTFSCFVVMTASAAHGNSGWLATLVWHFWKSLEFVLYELSTNSECIYENVRKIWLSLASGLHQLLWFSWPLKLKLKRNWVLQNSDACE